MESDCDFNDIGVRSFILSGAPILSVFKGIPSPNLREMPIEYQGLFRGR